MLKVIDTETGREYKIVGFTYVQQGEQFLGYTSKITERVLEHPTGHVFPILVPIRRKIVTQEDAAEWSRLNGSLLVSCSVGSRDPIRKACGYNYSASLATYSVQTSFNEWEKLTDLYVD